MNKIKIGLIGFGRMGEMFIRAMLQSELWDVAYICDSSSDARSRASQLVPDAKIVEDDTIIYSDADVQVVGLFTLADVRVAQILKAVEAGKHIIAEKPLATTVEEEWAMVKAVEATELITTVDLFMRNSWYVATMKDVVASGEIGELAIIRVCHLTPGLIPGEGHEYEGPAFHDCGMHYVDVARCIAQSEFKTGHAQAVRMWNYKDPWWLQCHGTFENGIVYDITQGFVYGQLSKDQTHNSYIELIGTKGLVRMTHDFKVAKVDIRGVNLTEIIEKPYGGKNADVLCEKMATSILTGKRDETLPSFRDAAIASEYSWRMLDDSRTHDLPAIGQLSTIDEIYQRRVQMSEGYGLLKKKTNIKI